MTASRLWRAYVPIPDVSMAHLWNTQILPDGTRAVLSLMLLLSLLLVAATALLLLRTPFVLFFYVVGTGGLLLFTYLVHAGELRHDGHLYLLWVASLWLAAYPSREWRGLPWLHGWTGVRNRWGTALITGVLLAQVGAAAIFYVEELRRPFSAATDVAAFLREHRLDRLPIAASHSAAASAVSGLLDRPVYHLSVGRELTFIPWGETGVTVDVDSTRLTQRLRPLLDSVGPEVVLLLPYPFEGWDEDIVAIELAHFPAGIEPSEWYHLYRVARLGGPSHGLPGSGAMPGR